MGPFKPGDQVTADDLNGIVDKLVSRITGGRGILIRSFNGQIIINDAPSVPKTNPELIMVIINEAPWYYDGAPVGGGEADWIADLATWNADSLNRVQSSYAVILCDVINTWSPYDDVTPYGTPDRMTKIADFPVGPADADDFIDAFNAGYTAAGFAFPPRVTFMIYQEVGGPITPVEPGLTDFKTWLDNNNIAYDELVFDYDSRWLFAVNDVIATGGLTTNWL